MSEPPNSFVPADDNLFPPLAHGNVWLAVGIVGLVLGAVLVVWIVRAVPDAAATERKAQLTLKGRYLAELDTLQRRFDDGLIDERELHHRLSHTVRRFAAEHGAPGALSMTAADLDAAGHPELSEVVTGYQPPQFMATPASDPPLSVTAARELIASW
jgi:hypothetical protein